MKNFIFLLILFLVGCGAETNPEKTPEGKIRVVFWHAMSGKLGETLEAMIKDFNRLHPEIWVEGVNMGSYDTLTKKLLASIIAGSQPNLAQNFEPLTRMFKDAGKILCLDEFLAKSGEVTAFKGDIFPSLLANNTFDGGLWSMPFNKSVSVLYFNRDHFKEAGLDPENPPATWEDLERVGKILRDFHQKQGKGGYPGGITLRNAWLFESMILHFGGNLYDAEARRCLTDSPAALEAGRFLHRLVVEGILEPAKGFDFQSDFVNQKNSLMISSCASKAFIEHKLPFSLGLAPLPQGARQGSILSGTNINIFKSGSEGRDQSTWIFLRWFCDSPQSARWALATSYVPVRPSAMGTEAMREVLQNDKKVLAGTSQLPFASGEPPIGEWFEIRQILDTMVENFLTIKTLNTDEVEKILVRGTREANTILQEEN